MLDEPLRRWRPAWSTTSFTGPTASRARSTAIRRPLRPLGRLCERDRHQRRGDDHHDHAPSDTQCTSHYRLLEEEDNTKEDHPKENDQTKATDLENAERRCARSESHVCRTVLNGPRTHKVTVRPKFQAGQVKNSPPRGNAQRRGTGGPNRHAASMIPSLTLRAFMGIGVGREGCPWPESRRC